MSTPAWLVATPIAHRGLHDRANGIVENTISAAEAAAARGFPIECDVQLTRDRDAVVFHDFTLERLTGEAGAVAERTSAAIREIAIAGSRSDRIPTLSDFLDRVDGRVPLVIEIKSRFNGDVALADRTCEILRGYSGPFCVKSFDPAVIARVRAIAPGIVRGIVAESTHSHSSYDALNREQKHALANLLHFEDSQPQFLSWRVQDLPAAAPYLARLLGRLPVMAWTVRDPDDRARAERYADQMVFEGFLP
jgi:glycerophosphoryl diester phosphodiesterase